MPRQPTLPYWVERIRSLKETEGLGPKAIRERLAAEDPDGSRRSPTSEKTIARRLKEYEALSGDQRRMYRLFSWPASMEEGSLPWEASRPVLDLVYHLQTTGERRPSTRLAMWYWRAHLAAPGADIPTLLPIARRLEAWDVSSAAARPDSEAIESFMAYAPWRSPWSLDAYESAVKKGDIPSWDEPGEIPAARSRATKREAQRGDLSKSVDFVLDLVDKNSPR